MREVYRTEFRTEPAEVKAGEAATLTLSIKDVRGWIVRDLAVVHERPMHLLVISEDLSEFYHLHPEQGPDGSFRVAHTFPYGGSYRLYVDYAPPGAGQVVHRLSLRCGGEPRPAVPLAEDGGATKTVDGLRVTMKPSRPLRAGEDVLLGFAAADALTGEAATDLEPYLGALAHFVIVSQDGAEFLHAHPAQKTVAAAAHAHGAREGREGMTHAHGGEMANAGAAEVSAHTRFPRAGLYKIWAQFRRGGRVITVPFVVRVAGGVK